MSLREGHGKEYTTYRNVSFEGQYKSGNKRIKMSEKKNYWKEVDDNGTIVRICQIDKNGKYDIVTIYDKYGNLTQTIEDITNDGVPEIYTFYGENGEQLERIDTRNFITAFLDNILGREVNFD